MKRLYFSISILSLPIHLMVGFSTGVVYAQVRDATEVARNVMVDEEIVAAGVTNPRVIESMRSTPRHEFVRSGQRQWAYLDMALPIGNG